MKKALSVCIAVFLVLGVALSFATQSVKAMVEPTTPTNDPWTWDAPLVTGTEVDVDLAANPAPATWLQLSSKALVLSGPANICVPFRNGQFNWMGEIYVLVDKQWVQLNTLNQFNPSKEGSFEACAYARTAGTYALFSLYPAFDTATAVVTETPITTTTPVATATMIPAVNCATLFSAPTYDQNSGKLSEMIAPQPVEVKVTFTVVPSSSVIASDGGFQPDESSVMTSSAVTWNVKPVGTWSKLAVQLSALGCTSKVYTFAYTK